MLLWGVCDAVPRRQRRSAMPVRISGTVPPSTVPATLMGDGDDLRWEDEELMTLAAGPPHPGREPSPRRFIRATLKQPSVYIAI
jgi:hypothetical protein